MSKLSADARQLAKANKTIERLQKRLDKSKTAAEQGLEILAKTGDIKPGVVKRLRSKFSHVAKQADV